MHVDRLGSRAAGPGLAAFALLRGRDTIALYLRVRKSLSTWPRDDRGDNPRSGNIDGPDAGHGIHLVSAWFGDLQGVRADLLDGRRSVPAAAGPSLDDH